MHGSFKTSCIAVMLGVLLGSAWPGVARAQLPEDTNNMPSQPVTGSTVAPKRPPRGGASRLHSNPNLVTAPAAIPPLSLPGSGQVVVPPGISTADLPLPGEKEFTECKRIPPGKKVVVSLKPDSELSDLIGWIKTISCRPFIIPSSIRQAKVTIVVPEAITANEAYRIFLSALESMGLTVQPDGRVLKIIESNRARESSIPVIGTNQEPPHAEQYVTRMLHLNHVYPDDVVAVLNRLKGRDGDITPYGPTNMLVITDLASNIKRMEEVVRALDVPMGGEKMWLIRLHNIAASEVATMLQQIFGVGKGGTAGAPAQRRAPLSMSSASTPGSPDAAAAAAGEGDLSISQIVPDDRTNSLILVSTEKTYQRVLALVKRLESQGEGMGGNKAHIYYLANANAEDMAVVLQGIGVSVGGGARRSTTGGRPGAAPAAPGATPTSGGGSAGLFQDEVKITSDKATNSLVILAGAKDYFTIKDVIRQLDIPRKQVYIEATVMEVNLAKQLNLGVSYHGGYDFGSSGVVVGGLSSSTLNSFNPLGAASLTGLAAGFVGPLFNSSSVLGTLGQSIPTYGALIQALQTNNDTNTLQMPNILTTDNEKATIQVGQNLPFPSASFSGLPTGGSTGSTGTTGGLGIGTSVQRQDVALKLEITPHVNSSDYVRLEIDNEISDVADPNYNGLGPATNKRTLKTVAVVRDMQPVVLGGVLRDQVTESITKIPLLGDIPILGYLFKIKQSSVQKQMLLIVLTPYIISDPSDLRRIFERKMRERREFIETYSAFRNERDFDKVVDFTRKRGALEEINRTALDAEREANELHAAEAGLRHREVEGGPVELPAQPLRGGFSAPASAPSTPSTPSLPPPAPLPSSGGTAPPNR